MTDQVRRSAADLLETAVSQRGSQGMPRALVGFDGFVDTIARAVGSRRTMQSDGFDAIPTIAAFGGRIAGSAGRSMNLELVALEERGGGNGPLMAGALASLGIDVTLIGALGKETSREPVHHAYAEVIARCAAHRSIAPTARTDAIEFDDGKVMFNWSSPLLGIDYQHIVCALGGGNPQAGEHELIGLLSDASLLATVNWTNMGGLNSIWEGLRERVFPEIKRHGTPPQLFVDLSDPAKRSDEDLRSALDQLVEFASTTDVTLGLNIAEAGRLSTLLDAGSSTVNPDPDSLRDTAHAIRTKLGLTTVVVHTRTGAGGSTENDSSASVRAKVVNQPVLSTGAGDHFNGGFMTSRALGLPLAESLACGCDTATHLVSTGNAPSISDLVNGLRLPT